jgi:deaminated glutathione amidase
MRPLTAVASLPPGSSVPQPFDHPAGRNLGLIRRHASLLLGEGPPFRYGRKASGSDSGPEPAR